MPKSPTVQLRNVSPLGDLSIPSLRLEVAADAVFETDAETAALLLEQGANFTTVTEG
jgi:hypothetical protein